MSQKFEFNKETVAKILEVHSVSHIEPTGNSELLVTYRQEEDDSSSWVELNAYQFMSLCKIWALEQGISLRTTPGKVGYMCETLQISNGETLAIHSDRSEPSAVLLACQHYDVQGA